MTRTRHLCTLAVVCLIAASAPAPNLKRQTFDQDPNWESFDNRITLDKYPTVTQNFGYSATTNTAGGESAGEIGGSIVRTTTPAWYAKKLDKPLTLREPITFSGTFTATNPRGGGVHFGLFNPALLGAGGRPPGALILDLDGAKTFVRAFVRCIAPDNRQCGSLLPPAPKVKEATPLPAQKPHRFKITFDGKGHIDATIDNLPPAAVDVPKEILAQDFTFTHFGILNVQKSGSPFDVYYDDIECNGARFDFAADPKWEAHGNHASFADEDIAGRQNYGFSPTHHAGGAPGEIGGTIWRSAKTSYYAKPIGPFDLTRPLEIKGKMTLIVGAPDSGALLAFFDPESLKTGGEGEMQNVLGLHIEGPSRVGHYVRPVLRTSSGKKAGPETGPVIRPDSRPHAFSFAYQPATGEQPATLSLQFDDQKTTYEIPAAKLTDSAHLTHFGLFPNHVGGSQVQLYVDDLSYSE